MKYSTELHIQYLKPGKPCYLSINLKFCYIIKTLLEKDIHQLKALEGMSGNFSKNEDGNPPYIKSLSLSRDYRDQTVYLKKIFFLDHEIG